VSHAEARLRERAPQFADMLPRLRQLAATGKRIAVRLGTLDEVAGDRRSSHGNTVWAILGDGTVITVMYRRSSQPKTPEAFDVDEVQLWG
jgi:hypothetical protein